VAAALVLVHVVSYWHCCTVRRARAEQPLTIPAPDVPAGNGIGERDLADAVFKLEIAVRLTS
jgi:hypothetical protein